MKKRFLLLLAIGLLSFGACGKQNDTVITDAMESAENEDVADDNDASNDDVSKDTNEDEKNNAETATDEKSTSETATDSSDTNEDTSDAKATNASDEVITLKEGSNELESDKTYLIGEDSVLLTESGELTINDKTYDMPNDDDFYDGLVYLNKDNTYWLLICSYWNDWRSFTPVYVGADHTAKMFECIEGTYGDWVIEKDSFTITACANLFGTYRYNQTYSLSPTEVKPVEGMNEFIFDDREVQTNPLYVHSPLTVYRADNDKEKTLETDTSVDVWGVDTTSNKFYIKADGTLYYFYYEIPEDDPSHPTINGKDEGEYLCGMVYAG